MDGSIFHRAGPIGMRLRGHAVGTQTFDPDADQPMLLKRREHAVENARFGPAAQPRVDCVPIAERHWQGTPPAAIFRHIQGGVDHGQIGNPHVATLNRQIGTDQFILLLVYLIHVSSLSGKNTQYIAGNINICLCLFLVLY